MASRLNMTKKAGNFACYHQHTGEFAQERVWSHRVEKSLDRSVCMLHETTSSAYRPSGDSPRN